MKSFTQGKVDQVFDFFDDNNDGEITQEEINSVMSVLPEMIYKSTEEMINKLDSNKDGVITADEMKNSKDKAKSKSVNYSVGVTIIL